MCSLVKPHSDITDDGIRNAPVAQKQETKHTRPPSLPPSPPFFFSPEVATEAEDSVGTPTETHGLYESIQITTQSGGHHNRLRHQV